MSETRGRGRPSHKPDEESRKRVQTESQFGGTHEHIAAILDISLNTLKKHYARELDRGLSFAVQSQKRNLWTRSQTSDDLLKYWLNTMGGLAPRSTKIVQGSDDGPAVKIDVRQFNPAQLRQILEEIAALEPEDDEVDEESSEPRTGPTGDE